MARREGSGLYSAAGEEWIAAEKSALGRSCTIVTNAVWISSPVLAWRTWPTVTAPHSDPTQNPNGL